MHQENNGKIIWFEIDKAYSKNENMTIDLGEYLMNFGRAIRGVEVVVVFKENLCNLSQVRINFRSQGRIDVNKIASCFGGGGHKNASGATIKGKISVIRSAVLRKIKSYLR